jgi:thymidylate synthase (FAD)
MLKIWEELYKLSPNMFSIRTTGAGCQRDKCQEGPMCCGVLMGKNFLPSDTLREDFPLFYDKR